MREKRTVDRRKYLRLDWESKVNLRTKAKAEPQATLETFTGISKNISAEGICFMSEKQFKPETRIELEILFPSESKPLHLEGEVRWSSPSLREQGKVMFDTGVKLLTVDESDESRFIGFVCAKMTERLGRHLHL